MFGWKCQTIPTTKQNMRAEPSEMRARAGSISMARFHKMVKGRTLNMNGVGYFRDKPVEWSAALTGTDSGPAGRGLLLDGLRDLDRRDRECGQWLWPIQK